MKNIKNTVGGNSEIKLGKVQNYSGVSISSGEQRVESQPSAYISNVNTSISERNIQDAETRKTNIQNFFNGFLVPLKTKSLNLGSIQAESNELIDIIEQDEKKIDKKAKGLFQKWFGISFAKYTSLMTSSDPWKLLDKDDTSKFLEAMEHLDDTTSFILHHKCQFSEAVQLSARNFLVMLINFLHDLDKGNQDVIESVRTKLIVEDESKQFELALKEDLQKLTETYGRIFSKPKRQNTLIRIIEEKNGGIQATPETKVVSIELNKQLKDALLIIFNNLKDLKMLSSDELLKACESLLALKSEDFDEGRQSLIQEAKGCLLKAMNHFLQSQVASSSSLGRKLQKRLEPGVVQEAIRVHEVVQSEELGAKVLKVASAILLFAIMAGNLDLVGPFFILGAATLGLLLAFGVVVYKELIESPVRPVEG